MGVQEQDLRSFWAAMLEEHLTEPLQPNAIFHPSIGLVGPYRTCRGIMGGKRLQAPLCLAFGNKQRWHGSPRSIDAGKGGDTVSGVGRPGQQLLGPLLGHHPGCCWGELYSGFISVPNEVGFIILQYVVCLVVQSSTINHHALQFLHWFLEKTCTSILTVSRRLSR